MSATEQKVRHTPGPWHVHQFNHARGDLWLSIGHTDAAGRKIGPVTEIIGSAVADTPPAWVPVARMKYLVTSDEEQWANARLIAASPDLLEAARALIEKIDQGQIGPRSERTTAALRAAIAKATED